MTSSVIIYDNINNNIITLIIFLRIGFFLCLILLLLSYINRKNSYLENYKNSYLVYECGFESLRFIDVWQSNLHKVIILFLLVEIEFILLLPMFYAITLYSSLQLAYPIAKLLLCTLIIMLGFCLEIVEGNLSFERDNSY